MFLLLLLLCKGQRLLLSEHFQSFIRLTRSIGLRVESFLLFLSFVCERLDHYAFYNYIKRKLNRSLCGVLNR